MDFIVAIGIATASFFASRKLFSVLLGVPLHDPAKSHQPRQGPRDLPRLPADKPREGEGHHG